MNKHLDDVKELFVSMWAMQIGSDQMGGDAMFVERGRVGLRVFVPPLQGLEGGGGISQGGASLCPGL